MSVELIESEEDFNACAEAWEHVFASDPAATVFLSHVWLRDLYRRRPGVCILAWREDDGEGQLRAFLPLRLRVRVNRNRRRLENSVCLAGNDWADHTGVLCSPDYEAEALVALGKALAQLSWRRLDLESLRMSKCRQDHLLRGLDESDHEVRYLSVTADDGQSSLDVSPCIELPASFEQWLSQSVSANTRQRIRRFRRRLAMEPDLSIRLSRSDTRLDDLDAFRRLWLSRWSELKGRSAEYKANTYVKMIMDGLASNQMRLTVFCVGGNPVAVNACYVEPVHRRVSFYAGARDPEFKSVPAGLLLHAETIEWAINNQFASYDLLRGNEAYKYSLAAQDHPVLTLRIRPWKLDPDRTFLHASCRDEALGLVQSAQPSARTTTIDRLYGQLLESFPSDETVLAHYATWLRLAGDALAADDIESSFISACQEKALCYQGTKTMIEQPHADG